MAKVSFNVLDEVRDAFNEAFADENKGAVIAALMRQAVEDRSRCRRRARAIDRLFGLRVRAKPVKADPLASFRGSGKGGALKALLKDRRRDRARDA